MRKRDGYKNKEFEKWTLPKGEDYRRTDGVIYRNERYLVKFCSTQKFKSFEFVTDIEATLRHERTIFTLVPRLLFYFIFIE